MRLRRTDEEVKREDVIGIVLILQANLFQTPLPEPDIPLQHCSIQ